MLYDLSIDLFQCKMGRCFKIKINIIYILNNFERSFRIMGWGGKLVVHFI